MSQDLALLDEKAIDTAFTEGNFDSIIGMIKDQVDPSQVYDMETKKGRDACRSMAYKVSRAKNTIDKAGAALVKAEKAKINDVITKLTDGRKDIGKQLQDLQDQVRKPLDEWEKVRSDVDTTITEIEALGQVMNFSAEQIEANIIKLDEYKAIAPEIVEDKLGEYNEALQNTSDILVGQLQVAKQREAERAELAALQAEKAERERNEQQNSSQGGSVDMGSFPGMKPVSTSLPSDAMEKIQGQVHRDIVQDMIVSCAVSETSAKSIVKAVFKKQIRHLSIDYGVTNGK